MQLRKIFGHKMFTGLVLLGATGAVGIHFYEKNASGPAYNPQEASHIQLSRQFISSCSPSLMIESQKMNDALDKYLLTGVEPFVKIDAPDFQECIKNKTQHALDIATLPASQWVDLDKATIAFQLMLGLGVALTGFKKKMETKNKGKENPAPSPRV